MGANIAPTLFLWGLPVQQNLRTRETRDVDVLSYALNTKSPKF